MTKTEIEDLKTNLQSYLETHGIDTSRLFRCINPDHTDNNPSMEYFKDNKVIAMVVGLAMIYLVLFLLWKMLTEVKRLNGL